MIIEIVSTAIVSGGVCFLIGSAIGSDKINRLLNTNELLRGDTGGLRISLDEKKRQNDRLSDLIGCMQKRLRKIADMETPSANATVQRMAAVARGVDYKHSEAPARKANGRAPKKVEVTERHFPEDYL